MKRKHVTSGNKKQTVRSDRNANGLGDDADDPSECGSKDEAGHDDADGDGHGHRCRSQEELWIGGDCETKCKRCGKRLRTNS